MDDYTEVLDQISTQHGWFSPLGLEAMARALNVRIRSIFPFVMDQVGLYHSHKTLNCSFNQKASNQREVHILWCTSDNLDNISNINHLVPVVKLITQIEEPLPSSKQPKATPKKKSTKKKSPEKSVPESPAEEEVKFSSNVPKNSNDFIHPEFADNEVHDYDGGPSDSASPVPGPSQRKVEENGDGDEEEDDDGYLEFLSPEEIIDLLMKEEAISHIPVKAKKANRRFVVNNTKNIENYKKGLNMDYFDRMGKKVNWGQEC